MSRVSRGILRVCLVALCLCNSSITSAEPHGSIDASAALDQQTQYVLQAIVEGDWATAQHNAKQLTERFPNYALGKLLYAETLQVAAGLPLKHQSENRFSLKYVRLLLEAKTRAAQPTPVAGILTQQSTTAELLPAALIHTGNTIDHIILVDLKRSYMMLYDTQHAEPRLIKRHYIASGLGGFGKRLEGDLKTPLGVYKIHGFRSDHSLPTLYGSGALMLNYPNSLDKLQGRTGSGIWLHGVPHDQKSRSPRSSEGCVTMANDYLLELRDSINLQSTRVVLSDDITWLTPEQLRHDKQQQLQLFERYRRAWTNMNLINLQALYNDGAWPLAAKQLGLSDNFKRVSQSSPTSKQLKSKHAQTLAMINRDTLSSIVVPGSENIVQMSFQHGDKNEIHTTLYWQKQPGGHWQIIQEDNQQSGI